MDEEAHWLVCEDGLKKRCEQSLRHCTIMDLGFIKDGNSENENHDSVHGIWHEHSLNSQHSLAVIDGLFVLFLYCYLHHCIRGRKFRT